MKSAFRILFLLFFCCAVLSGCASETDVAVATAPTEPPELFADGISLESAVDDRGNLRQEHYLHRYENGVMQEYACTTYDESGAVTAYHQTLRHETGIPSAILDKAYDDTGALIRTQEVSFYANGSLQSNFRSHFDALGRRTSSFYESYFPDSTVQTQKTHVLDKETGYYTIKIEENREDGTTAHTEDCTYDGDFQWLEGVATDFSPSGAVIFRQTRTYDAEAAAFRTESTAYGDVGTVESALVQVTRYDESGYICFEETTEYGPYQVFLQHFSDAFHYDDQGRITEQTHINYLENGNIQRTTVTTCDYNDAGQISRKNETFYDKNGVVQSSVLSEFLYDNSGSKTRASCSSYFGSGVQMAAWDEIYDTQGRLIQMVTTTSKGITITQTYTHTPEGKPLTELTATQKSTAKTISYRKISYTYHENGEPWTITRQDWTSADEQKAAPDTAPDSLGKTFIMEFDEYGTRVR